MGSHFNILFRYFSCILLWMLLMLQSALNAIFYLPYRETVKDMYPICNQILIPRATILCIYSIPVAFHENCNVQVRTCPNSPTNTRWIWFAIHFCKPFSLSFALAVFLMPSVSNLLLLHYVSFTPSLTTWQYNCADEAQISEFNFEKRISRNPTNFKRSVDTFIQQIFTHTHLHSTNWQTKKKRYEFQLHFIYTLGYSSSEMCTFLFTRSFYMHSVVVQ